MSTSLVVQDCPAILNAAETLPRKRSLGPSILMVIGAIALCGLGFRLLSSVAGAVSLPAHDVHVSNLKISGLFGDVVNGRLINEGSGGEVYVWVEFNGEPGCAHHTYLRTNSEYSFSFVCGRMTFGSGQLHTYASQSPPEWVKRTATSLD